MKQSTTNKSDCTQQKGFNRYINIGGFNFNLIEGDMQYVLTTGTLFPIKCNPAYSLLCQLIKRNVRSKFVFRKEKK